MKTPATRKLWMRITLLAVIAAALGYAASAGAVTVPTYKFNDNPDHPACISAAVVGDTFQVTAAAGCLDGSKAERFWCSYTKAGKGNQVVQDVTTAADGSFVGSFPLSTIFGTAPLPTTGSPGTIDCWLSPPGSLGTLGTPDIEIYGKLKTTT